MLPQLQKWSMLYRASVRYTFLTDLVCDIPPSLLQCEEAQSTPLYSFPVAISHKNTALIAPMKTGYKI